MSRASRVAVLLAAALTLGAPAAAQPSAREGETAIAVGQKAMDLFRAGNWSAAFEQFSAANRMAHSPVFVLFMARCRREQGDLIAARDLYRRIASEAIPEGAPEPWTRARSDAETELAALTTRIPKVRVTIAGRDAASASLVVDGAAVEGRDAARPLELNPGEHVLEARAGASVAQRKVALAAGSAPLDVELVLGGAPSGPSGPFGPSSAATVAPPPSSAPGAARAAPGSVVPGVIALGVGALALGVGAGAGIAAKSKADDVLGRCQGAHCLAADADEADASDTLATVSTVSFVLAAVAVPVGAVLLWWRPGGGASSGVVLAPRWAGAQIRGTF